jgi:translation initiation factor IF-2
MVVPKRMTEANEQEANEQEQKRPLTLGRSGTRLELRRPVETGQVRQSFSHGRSKTVTVEVRKKRILVPGGAPEPGRVEPAAPAGVSPSGVNIVARSQPAAPAPAAEPTRRPVIVPRALTPEERAGRVRALQDARKADDESRYRAELEEADRLREAEERAVEEARRRTEEDARRRADDEDARKRADEEAKKHADDEEARRKEEESRREVAERAG